MNMGNLNPQQMLAAAMLSGAAGAQSNPMMMQVNMSSVCDSDVNRVESLSKLLRFM
jgi:hypothetical protein